MKTKTTKHELLNGVKDEFGVVFSTDGKRLLKCVNNLIEDYSIKNGTEVICDRAFENCTLLKEVYISDSVTTIGQKAFALCPMLYRVVLPDSLQEISKSAFDYDNNLSYLIVAEDNMPKIKQLIPKKYRDYLCTFQAMFSNEASTPQKEPYIEYSPDGKCLINYFTSFMDDEEKKKYKSYTVWQGVEVIDKNAFSAEYLATVTLPDTIKEIREAAFQRCYSLANINLPKSLKILGDYCFSGCKKIRQLTIPASVEEIGHNPFCNSLNLKSLSRRFVVDDGMLIDSKNHTLIAYTGTAENIIIPISVNIIGENAFNSCKTIKHVTIGDKVKKICFGAFRSSTVESVNIIGTVEEIASCTFWQCSALKKVILPQSVTKIADKAFAECTSLEEINLPSNIKIIDNVAFGGCTALKHLTIPNSVETIRLNPFFGCVNLKLCSQSKKFVIENGLLIDCVEHQLIACTSQDRFISIPQSVETIGDISLARCKNIQQVSIPNSVSVIKQCAFQDCEALERVEIPNSIKTIERGAFDSCKSLMNIHLPNTITIISDMMFVGCSSLQKIVIPESVISIQYGAFKQCESLEKITIPSSVKSISSSVFAKCHSLQEVTFSGSIENIGIEHINEGDLAQSTFGNDIFSECPSLQKIIVPKRLLAQIKQLLPRKYWNMLYYQYGRRRYEG